MKRTISFVVALVMCCSLLLPALPAANAVVMDFIWDQPGQTAPERKVSFDEKDMAFMQTVADLYKSRGQVPCTACAYCMPCPAGVDIPGNFKIFNSASDALLSTETTRKDIADKRKAFLKLYNEQPKGVRADACVTCNACLPKCPQHISIPQHMQHIKDLVAKI